RSRRPEVRREPAEQRAYVQLRTAGVPVTPPRRIRSMRRLLPGLAALAGIGLLSGCFNPFQPEILNQRVTSAAPTPNSPQNAVKLFEWCWVNRGVDEYRELFTDDYVFQSATTDSAGNGSRDILTRRDDEVQTAENMFIGSAERPPAEQITLIFDKNLVSFPDSRPGKDPQWHRQIRTSVDLNVRIDTGNTVEVQGSALFFLTRASAAAIPAERTARGFKPDPRRWWIDRWEDETLSGASPALRSRGAKAAIGAPVEMSMAELRRLYYVSPSLGNQPR